MGCEKFVSARKVITVLLAGGRSSRMGRQNKALLPWSGTTLVDTVRQRLAGNGSAMIISANDDTEILERYGLPVIPDDFGGYAGPLAGIAAAMNAVENERPDTEYLLLSSCDTPFVPLDLLERLTSHKNLLPGGALPQLVLPVSNGRTHPLHGLWALSLRQELVACLEEGGRRVQQFANRFSPVIVDFPVIGAEGQRQVDPFANINNPDDYAFYKNIGEQYLS